MILTMNENRVKRGRNFRQRADCEFKLLKRHSMALRSNHNLQVVLKKINVNIGVNTPKKSKEFLIQQPVISLPKLSLCQKDLIQPDEMLSFLHCLKHEEADKSMLLQHCNTNSVQKTTTNNGFKYSKTVIRREFLSVSSKNVSIDLKNVSNNVIRKKQCQKKTENLINFVVNSPINDLENQPEKTKTQTNSFIDSVHCNIPADFKEKQFDVRLRPLDNFLILNMQQPFHGQRMENKFIETVSKTEKTFATKKTKIYENHRLQRLQKNDFYSKESTIETNSIEVVSESYTETVNKTQMAANNSIRYKRRNNFSSSVLPSKRKREKTETRTVAIANTNMLIYNSRPLRQCRLRNMKPEEITRCIGESAMNCPNLISSPNVIQPRMCSQKSKKLNVSFKTPDLDDDIKWTFNNTLILSRCDVPVSSTPCPKKNYQAKMNMSFGKKSHRKTVASRRHMNTKTAFSGFSENNSNIARSADSSLLPAFIPSIKSRKRMTRREAQQKTQSYNNSKKIMEKIRPKTRFSQRLAVKKLAVCSPVPSEKKTIRKRKNSTAVYVLLNKLNNADVSSYKITPLREERRPGKGKNSDDYGIEDVNTDDSTDDEEFPKKVIPHWAKEEVRKKCNVEVSRKLISQWMRPPKFRNSLMKTFFK